MPRIHTISYVLRTLVLRSSGTLTFHVHLFWALPPPLPYPLAESRVCEPVQPGNHEPPGEEETGLHPRADGDRGEIRGRPADRPGGNAKVFHITFRHIQDMW